MTLTTSVHLSLTLAQGGPRLSSELGGRTLTCIILPLYLRSGPGHWKPVACWAPPETLPKAGSSVTWGRKVKCVPCRDAAASWTSSTKLWPPPCLYQYHKGDSSVFCLLIILVLFLSLFRTLASHRGAMYYTLLKRCYVLYHGDLMVRPWKDAEEGIIFTHLTDENWKIPRIKGPRVNHCSLVQWVLSVSPLMGMWFFSGWMWTEVFQSDDSN